MEMKCIEEARIVLKDVIERTPIIKADKVHRNLWIKAENLQDTGAFKLRGAYYRLSKLSEKEKSLGVICASAGNHAQGVAYSCQKMNIKGTIVMPKTAPLSKIEATRAYGVHVVLQGDTFNDAYEYAKNLQEIEGSIFIEPFNDEYIMAGQGTIGLEILEKMPDVECVLVPVGGGGLAAGIAYAIKTLKPDCKVYGVEASNAASMMASFEANEIQTLSNVSTIADGIAVKSPGNLTFEVCRKYLDGIVSVSEEEIAAAILILLEKMKMVGEGAGASAIAAAMFHKVAIDHTKCVAILSGGNIDVNFLSRIIDLGLLKTGRKAIINLEVVDKPGNLSKVIEVVGSTGANIVSVNHNRIFENALFNKCRVGLVIETFNHRHIQEVIEKLVDNGYEPNVVSHNADEHLD